LFTSLVSVIKEGYTFWFFKPPLVHGRKEKKTIVEQFRKVYREVVTKEEFISEQQLISLTNILPQPVQQSQWVKIWTKPSTPKDRLSLEPTSSPPKKKPHTCKWIMVMEGGDEDMEANITMQ